ncbi:MAG: septum formation protein Maf [Omnitrophica WOR_2 bacterium RIFCSPLOWO2_12_FULL_46_30]|nr:MAG: septum formation protein Maf [Omnitrophica WOR_2 bacterium RIFCSPHIGHO2_02_FULL_46_37]OGX52095.1 MAG: septum formation protein Maf [Omnitrophica WOR_2 bacterium RIFCSPLOWO2_12_FULL_46_30]
MRKIILASGSKARQKLLKQIGLTFRVAKSGLKESRELKRGCAALVMRNAYRKAKDVAKRFQRGVVIGADTVVLAGSRLIGKPSSMGDAFRSLKLLSRKPQWVYTGIAIVDIDNGRTLSDYEKTRIYMYPLSDRQIKNYFKKVSPFDKAGSFDIQGSGSIFIDRIEGCFYNVVGLPLAKLARMLKEAGIDVF